jgi:hypothetical protein
MPVPARRRAFSARGVVALSERSALATSKGCSAARLLSREAG